MRKRLFLLGSTLTIALVPGQAEVLQADLSIFGMD
jgi:hypothetical protein